MVTHPAAGCLVGAVGRDFKAEAAGGRPVPGIALRAGDRIGAQPDPVHDQAVFAHRQVEGVQAGRGDSDRG